MNNSIYYHLFDSIVNTYLIEHCDLVPNAVSDTSQVALVVSSFCEASTFIVKYYINPDCPVSPVLLPGRLPPSPRPRTKRHQAWLLLRLVRSWRLRAREGRLTTFRCWRVHPCVRRERLEDQELADFRKDEGRFAESAQTAC
jgi:hypothetical protein